MTLYEELQNTNFPYSPTVVRDLIDSNYRRYGYVRAATKKIIFYMVRRIVLRGAVTFININRNRSNETAYGIDDMVTEIYFVLDKCVEKFDTRIKKDFYLYFSSSVTRRMTRMANYKSVNNEEQTFTSYAKKVTDDEDFFIEELIEDPAAEDDSTNEFMEYLESIPFTDEERGVLESLKNERCTRDAMRENGMNQSEYNEAMEGIREKLRYSEVYDELMTKLSNLWMRGK